MAAIGTGDLAALESLYDRYSTLVYSVSLRVLRDTHLAEDVVQEVFLRLWRQPSSYDPARGRFISWLMSVTRNRSLDELRRVTRRMRSEEAEDDDRGHEIAAVGHLDDPQVELTMAEVRTAVRAAMTRLPPAQRQVIELAYFEGLTHVEIAGRTGDPLGTVKTRVRLGMRKLRESLAEFAGWEADRGMR
ncbi:MAG: sigma-70 family RNA polymerase sigma factor [Dehalococcoidia bacterium]